MRRENWAETFKHTRLRAESTQPQSHSQDQDPQPEPGTIALAELTISHFKYVLRLLKCFHFTLIRVKCGTNKYKESLRSDYSLSTDGSRFVVLWWDHKDVK